MSAAPMVIYKTLVPGRDRETHELLPAGQRGVCTRAEFLHKFGVRPEGYPEHTEHAKNK